MGSKAKLRRRLPPSYKRFTRKRELAIFSTPPMAGSAFASAACCKIKPLQLNEFARNYSDDEVIDLQRAGARVSLVGEDRANIRVPHSSQTAKA